MITLLLEALPIVAIGLMVCFSLLVLWIHLVPSAEAVPERPLPLIDLEEYEYRLWQALNGRRPLRPPRSIQPYIDSGAWTESELSLLRRNYEAALEIYTAMLAGDYGGP